MKTFRELMNEKPLRLSNLGPRPEWTVSIRDGRRGFRLLVVDTKTGRSVTEAGLRRSEGALVAEALYLAAEAEGTVPGLINCGPEQCFHDTAFTLWAVRHFVILRFGKPGTRYIAYKTHPVSALVSKARSSGRKERKRRQRSRRDASRTAIRPSQARAAV